VYDDEEIVPEPTKIDSEESQNTGTEANLFPKYTEAIAKGIELLNKLTVEKNEVEDQVEEEAPDEERPPKRSRKDDIYNRYPLPAVIGTKLFMEDDYCGLYVEGRKNSCISSHKQK
jgi:hypothetical protein